MSQIREQDNPKRSLHMLVHDVGSEELQKVAWIRLWEWLLDDDSIESSTLSECKNDFEGGTNTVK